MARIYRENVIFVLYLQLLDLLGYEIAFRPKGDNLPEYSYRITWDDYKDMNEDNVLPPEPQKENVCLDLEEGRTSESQDTESGVAESSLDRGAKKVRRECQSNLVAKEEISQDELIKRLLKENAELKKENAFLKKQQRSLRRK